MLPFFRRKAEPQPTGDWWTDTFTPEEHATIEGVFAPLGGGTAESLARSTNPNSLGTLAEYLKKEHLRHLGYKLLDRADTLVNENVPVLDLHFYFAGRGGFYYRWRDYDPFALDEAVKSFQRQIGLGANVARFFREDKNWASSLPTRATGSFASSKRSAATGPWRGHSAGKRKPRAGQMTGTTTSVGSTRSWR